MTIKNSEKKDLVKLLHNNEDYMRSLEAISDQEERRKIKAFTEDIFVNVTHGLRNLLEFAKKKQEEEHKKDEDISKK